MEKCRAALARLETEHRHLQDEFARCEQRSSKLELQKVAHEGDVQRLQMMVQEREAIIQVTASRITYKYNHFISLYYNACDWFLFE